MSEHEEKTMYGAVLNIIENVFSFTVCRRLNDVISFHLMAKTKVEKLQNVKSMNRNNLDQGRAIERWTEEPSNAKVNS